MEIKQKKRIVLEIVILVAGILFFRSVWNVGMRQVCLVIAIILIGAWVLAKVIKIPGIPQLISLLGVSIWSAIVNWLAESSFAIKVSTIYNKILSHGADWIGVKAVTVNARTSIVITFWGVFLIILAVLAVKGGDHTAMKKKVGSTSEEFKEKNFSEKSEMFCRTLRQRLESLNKDNDWNENLFTPLDAEIEVCFKNKRKNKYDDLLKCLKCIIF